MNNDYIDYDFCKPKFRQRKQTDFASQLDYYDLILNLSNPNFMNLHHPDLTVFKKTEKEYKRHNNYFEKICKYPLDVIHITKPKIELKENSLLNSTTKYYISMIQKLFDINETKSFNKLKKFNGDVYITILFG